MFELRLQDAHAARSGNVDGLPRGRFTTYDEALHALDDEHERLTAQLAANGEVGRGCSSRWSWSKSTTTRKPVWSGAATGPATIAWADVHQPSDLGV